MRGRICPTERWSALTRRGYREDDNGVLSVDADPMIGEMLRAAPPATANLWPFWRRCAEYRCWLFAARNRTF